MLEECPHCYRRFNNQDLLTHKIKCAEMLGLKESKPVEPIIDYTPYNFDEILKNE